MSALTAARSAVAPAAKDRSAPAAIPSYPAAKLTCRRVRGAGDLHGDDGRRARERAREPDEALEARLGREEVEELGDAHADERADEVAPYEHARLRKRRVDGAVYEYGRSTLSRGECAVDISAVMRLRRT